MSGWITTQSREIRNPVATLGTNGEMVIWPGGLGGPNLMFTDAETAESLIRALQNGLVMWRAASREGASRG